MRLGELDIPDAVLDARDRGELLVFAGAGVSLGGTAQYPDFKGLIQMIEHHSGRCWHGENFDHYLGALENAGVDIHRAAKQILTNPISRPNPVHIDIVRLFRDAESVRIVTTNFDEHFSSVARTHFSGAVRDFAAPALPVGNRFSGIVYVHGSVNDSAEHLVLTDRDFGKAYSTEGWARRFLVDAFRKYTVLFVGYSHNDPPMVYLTRGLTPDAERLYAISVDSDNAHWCHLGITPIPYHLRKSTPQHAAVETAIRVWAGYARMQTLDHKTEICQLLNKSPAKLPKCKDSYLRRCFRKRELLQFFYEDGLRVDWLLWAEKAELLLPAFTRPMPDNMAYAQHVAYWFSRHAVRNHKEALSVYMRAKLAIPQHLWYAIGQAYHSAQKEMQAGRAKWAVQLCMHWRPAYSTNFLEYAMIASAEQGDYDTALMLLEFLSTPRIIHERSFRSCSDSVESDTTSARVKITATRGEYWFAELWKKHLKPQLAQYDLRLAEMATSKLDQAHELQVVSEAASKGYDAVSWDRSAIEASDQDKYRSEFHMLVDIARDSFEQLIKTKRTAALALQTRWSVARSPLLNRLAIHGMRIDKRRSANTKLRWVIDHDLLVVISLHHEVFLLVCEIFPAARPDLQKDFLAFVRKVTRRNVRNSREIEEGVFWHHEFTLLDRLQDVTGGKCRAVSTRLAAIKKKFPEFRTSDHPEYTHYSYGVEVGSRSPLSVSELRAKSTLDALRYVIHFKGGDWRGPTRDGLIWILQSAVKETPEWGLDIAQRLAKRKRYPVDLWPALVKGWGNVKMDEDTWHDVLIFLRNIDINLLPLHATAQLLYYGVSAEGSLPDKEYVVAERLAFSVLSKARVSSSLSGASKNWYSWAINNTGGIICEFLIFAVSKRYQKDKGNWKGLPSRYKQQFKRMMAGRTMADQAGRTILAAYIHNLYAWDSIWVVDYLLPAFDWDKDDVAAIQVWHGFLATGKWNPKYLQRMIPYYKQSVTQAQTGLKDEADRLAAHIAGICLFSRSRRARGTLLVEFFHSALLKQRVAFANAIRSVLHDVSPGKRHVMWTDWLSNYWQERNLGKPVLLSPEEMQVMVSWCPLLIDDFPEAVHLLIEGEVPEECDVFCLHTFLQTGLAEKFPETTARFILYLVKNHSHDYMHVADVFKVSNELVQKPKTHEILNELVELLACRGHIQEVEELVDAIAKNAKSNPIKVNA